MRFRYKSHLEEGGTNIRAISFLNSEEVELEFQEKEKKFDPEKVYEGQPSPTKL